MSWIADKIFANADDFLDWLDNGFGEYIEKHISENHVHHTWKPNHSNYPKYTTLQLHRNMRSFHVNTNKWDDIAQNITIGKDGDIVTGRDIRKIPISAKYYNGSTNWHPFAYEMIGNFDKGNDKLEGEQLESAIKISRYFYLKGKGVKFHRELLINGKQPKSCPGTGIEKDWFMDLVKEKPVVKSVIIEGGKPKSHTITKGDTFYSIAKKFGFTVKQIEEFNPRVDSSKLQIGDVIHLVPFPDQPKVESKPVEKKPAPKPQPKPKKKYVVLPASNDSWRVYPTNKAPVKGNESGYLNPKKFNGLTYEVLGSPQANVVTIQSSNFGRVNIFVAQSTGAKFIWK